MYKFKSFAPLFIIIAALLWSADGLIRRGLYTTSPVVVVFLEHMIGLVLMTPFLLKKVLRETKSLSKKEWMIMLGIGLFSGALGTVFYTAALAKVQYIQFSVVALLQQLQPIWAIALARIVLGEKIDKSFFGWALLAIVSSYFVTFKNLEFVWDAGAGTILAAIFALLAGMMWASSTSFSKIILKKVSSDTATYLRFATAPLFAFIIMIVLGQVGGLMTITNTQWVALIAIALSTGMVAQHIYYFGLKRTPGKTAAICELMWPASAVCIDYFYLHNPMTWTQILGVIGIVLSVYNVTKRSSI